MKRIGRIGIEKISGPKKQGHQLSRFLQWNTVTELLMHAEERPFLSLRLAFCTFCTESSIGKSQLLLAAALLCVLLSKNGQSQSTNCSSLFQLNVKRTCCSRSPSSLFVTCGWAPAQEGNSSKIAAL